MGLKKFIIFKFTEKLFCIVGIMIITCAQLKSNLKKLDSFLTNANSYVICFEQAVLQCWYNNAKFFF